MAQNLPKNQIGQTKSAGYEFGIRRTVHISPGAAWDFLLSPRGLRIWLGELDSLPIDIGAPYRTSEGVRGKIRAGKPGSHLRMDWQAVNRNEPSILQIRVMSVGEKTTISFHLERLEDDSHRLEMSRHWSEVMEQILRQLRNLTE